jgi:mannose-6-phosphate isomerase-like protein (cupin superfamily)
MDAEDLPRCGEVRVSATRFDATVAFLETFGFRLEEIAPADDPAEALMTGHGLRLRLEVAYQGATELVVPAGNNRTPGRHLGPSGLVVEVSHQRELEVPPAAPAFVHTRFAKTPFHEGRAGLLYRDLLPSRLGGRWIASHIQAARGGPVNDRVHHHRVRLQLLYCLSGEAELVYQDEGPPFAFRSGDLVLQPPGLRHRVLTASEGFQVVELASPARHPTLIDHEMVLPSPDRLVERRRSHSGQQFLHTVADRVSPLLLAPGVAARDLGVHAASGGLVTARVLQFEDAGSVELREADDLRFLYVSAGAGSIDGATSTALEPGDAVALPPGRFLLTGSPGLRILEVTSSARVPQPSTVW